MRKIPVFWAKTGAWLLGALLVLTMLIVVGLPLLASTQIVRDRIAYQMSAWTGYRVRLDQSADIRVWPAFQAVLKGVTLSDWDRDDPHPVLEAERIEIDLSALAALRGKIVFTEMDFTRPVLRLTEESGRLEAPSPVSWGRLARSMETARAVVKADPANPDKAALPSDKLGEITFSHGRIVTGADAEQQDLATSINGTIEWPALNRPGSLSADGIWRGENVSITASSDQPLFLLAGGNAPLNFKLDSAPASASFAGTASLSGDGFVDGQFDLSAPSLSRLAEWVGLRTFPANRIGNATMTARMTGSVARLKFENSKLTLEESTGSGLLDITWSNGRPNVVGTLAFDTLDLDALWKAFSPFSPATRERMTSPNGFDFDLRFSATSADFGPATLSNVAAAAKAKDGFATFDISDATAFGGTLQLGVRCTEAGNEDEVDIRIAGNDVDTGQMSKALALKGLVPHARSTFSVALKGTGNNLNSILESANGNASLSLGSGEISGLDLDRFLKLSEAGDFFPVSSLSDGNLPIEQASLKATLSKGVAEITTAEANSGQYRISVNGLVPVAGRGLALYGSLASANGEDQRLNAPLTFFVGGSWNAPFITSFYSAGPVESRE